MGYGANKLKKYISNKYSNIFYTIENKPLGTGGAVKGVVTKTGAKVALTRAGKQTLTKMISRGVSRKSALKSIGRVIEEGGEQAAKKYVAKSGLKWMGQEIVPRKVFTKLLGEPTRLAMSKIPYMDKMAKGFKKALKPFAELDEMPAKLGGKGVYKGAYTNFIKATRNQELKSIDHLFKLAKPVYKQSGKDIGKTIAWKLESKKLTGDVMVDGLIKAMRKESSEMLKLERLAGKKIGEISGYVKHHLTPEAREWVGRGGDLGQFVAKPLRAKLASANKRKITGAIREINADFKIKTGLKFNFFEPDAIKAFAQRKVEHIRFINTKAFLEQTKRFGAKAVYKDEKLIPTFKEGIEFLETKAPELKGLVFPKAIAKHVDETYKVLTNEESLKVFVRAYDKLLSFWKGTVTGYFPAFHTRNAIGGSFNNWLAGIKNPLRYKQTRDILTGKNKTYKNALGETIKGSELMRQAERFGALGQPGMMDVMKTSQKEISKLGKGKFIKQAAGYPRIMMEYVENHLRMPLFLDRWMKGDSFEEAAKWVFKFHFDYMPEGLAGFERVAMRRLIPFYVWTRNNVPLQIEMLMKQPGKYAGLEKMRQTFMTEKGKEELQYLPDWMKEMFVAKLPFLNKAGKSLWLQLDIPIEDINKLPITSSGIREIASLLTPFLKYPIERYMNKDFFFGGEIWNDKLPKELQTRKTIEALKVLPSPIKKFLGFKEVQYRDYRYPEEYKFITRYEMSARKLHIIRSAFGRFYSTLGQILDPEMKSKMGWMKASRLLGGVPVRPFNMEEEKERRLYEQEKEMEEALRYYKQRGIIPYKGMERKVKKVKGFFDL